MFTVQFQVLALSERVKPTRFIQSYVNRWREGRESGAHKRADPAVTEHFSVLYSNVRLELKSLTALPGRFCLSGRADEPAQRGSSALKSLSTIS